jgi:CotS family spore coat protein
LDTAAVKELIEQNYYIKVQHLEKVKNVYRIEAVDNGYCLKIIKYELGHFLFIYSAMKHLQNNGFNKIPEFIPNKYGEEYIKVGDDYAYLTAWVNARECNYDNPLDITNAALKLAELHNKSLGFNVAPYMKPRIGWLKWMDIFKTRKNEILDFKMRIERKEKYSEFDYYYLSMMKEELHRCDRAIKHLMKSGYIEKMKEEIKGRGFCHHDYANHNILIENNGDVNIIDFDYCMLDSHLHDLSSLLIRRMKNGKWSLENVSKILNDYSTVNEVYKEDIPIMSAFIEFPQAYWQRGIQYYWEKKPWGEDFFLRKLRKIDEDKEERQDFVDEFRVMKF